jgi:two-component system CheB/CheR fusion protein
MLEQVQRLLGQPLLDVRSPVSEEMYRRIVSTVVGTVSTLTETTFGAIPPAAGDAIQKMVGADRFTGIAYVVEGELYGTSVLVMRPGTPDPSPDLLASFAHMAAVSLRRCAVEEALVESEEKFRVLAEQSPNMIFINRKSRVVYANRRCEEIMGHTRDEFRSPDFDFFSLHPPEWKDAVRSLFRRHMKGEEVEPLEYSLVTRDGGRIEAILTVRLISYEGEPAVFGTITDVTELRRLQRQVLETAERERRRTGSDMHDVLGQNLTGAAMLSEALEKSLAGAAPSEAPKAAQLTKLLYEATGQVRQFAKGLCPVDTTPEGLMKALTELASNTSQLFRISCRFRAAGRVLVHDGDAAEHLYRIAQEAITNSVKHGGAKNVTVALRSADGNLTLSVQDDGKGFPEDSAEGAGLGLRIMRHRTNMMHGILDTRNAPDGGAVVSCTVAGAAGKSLKRPRGTGRAAGRERRR